MGICLQQFLLSKVLESNCLELCFDLQNRYIYTLLIKSQKKAHMKLINLPKLDTGRSSFFKLKVIMGIGLLFCSLSSFSQEARISSGGSAIATFGGKIETNTMITEIAYAKKVVGSFYLDTAWNTSDVYLVRDSIILKGLETRLDLRNNVLEIKYKGELKTLPTFRIRSVFYPVSNSLFVTESVLKSSNSGFYKILVDDEKSLLCKYDTKISPATYNVALNTGSRDDKIEKEKHYYLYNESELIELENSKSKLKKQFKTKTDLLTYLKSHKTNPKNEFSLIQFVDYINQNQLQL